MINVPLSQSIRFRPINTDLPNFDNTFAADKSGAPYDFTFYVPEQSLQIQVVTQDDNEALSYMDLIHNGTRTRITDLSTSYIGAYKYETYTINFALYPNECGYIEVFLETSPGAGETLSYRSERFTIASQPNYLLIEWLNSENAFQLDYSVGLTHAMQLEANQWKLTFGGESSNYINQGEEVKLKESVARIFLLECELPDYLIEILRLATAHDHFYINGIEFVRSEEPAITQLGTSGMYSFSGKVRQRTIVGLNTHDVG